MGLRTRDISPVAERPIRDEDLATLGRSFRGDLVTPASASYDTVRQVWNGMVDRRPALIARCLGVADVAAAVRFARDAELELSVRGGGHSVVGHSVVDGAVVVDLSLMRGVHVDRDRRTARVQGGALVADLDREAQPVGLATTSGTAPDTGLGGYVLGGGYGWLSRRLGLACDNLRAVELVTANGERLEVTAASDPDLFWALRGAGTNFGVATAFELDLHPFAHPIAYADIFFRLDDGRRALEALRDLLASGERQITGWASVMVANPTFPVPEAAHGQPIVGVGWIWTGDDPGEGMAFGRPLHEAATPLGEAVRTVSLVELQTGAGLVRPRQRHYWKSSLLTALDDATIDAFIAAGVTANRDGDRVTVELVALGGAIGDVPDDGSAYGHRNAVADFLAVASWDDADDDEDRIGLARTAWQTVAEAGNVGVYVNNLGGESDRVRDAYGAAKFDRLAGLKRRYDPDNVFRHNANIPPA